MSAQIPFEFSIGMIVTDSRHSVTAVPAGFEPKYGCVEPSDEWGGIAACVALVVGRPLDVVRQVAVGRFNVSTKAQWSQTRGLAVSLLAHFGWTGGYCQSIEPISRIPDLAFVVTATPEDCNGKATQRCLLFHRQRPAPGKPGVEYMVDPYPGSAQCIRFDVMNIVFSHFMDVYWMQSCEDY